MTKQLKAYVVFIRAALSQINDKTDLACIRTLIDLHQTQIQAFAHERLIHLLVTFFFGMLCFACLICTAVWPLWQFIALDAVLIILLGFYIQHYYFLENTLQSLYPITQQLYKHLGSGLIESYETIHK